MILIQKGDIANNLRAATKLDIQQLPQVAINSGIVAPIVDVTPNTNELMLEAVASASTSSASNSLLTTSGKPGDYYLYGASINMIKDSTCDNADGTFSIEITGFDNQGVSFARIPLLTLTAQERILSFILPKPIRIKAGSAVSLSQPTFTVGKFRRDVVLFYVVR